jgi:hypothetical protein
MIRSFAFALVALSSASAFAQQVETVRGYFRANGTYVEPYHRTAPDSSPYNNYSTYGNTNPYTGAPGTVHPGNFGTNPYGAIRY